MTRRRALILEGGGMRGAYVAGVAASVARAAGPGYFDCVYGVSAGAFNGSLVVAGQPDVMTHIWRELLHGGQFIRWGRPFLGRPVMDLDYLVRILKAKDTRLDVEALRAASCGFVVVATDGVNGGAVYLDGKRAEVFDAMRASSALRLLYPRPILVDGLPRLDATYSDPLPVRRVIEDGHDTILVVRSRPAKAVTSGAPPWLRRLMFPRNAALRRGFAAVVDRYKAAVRLIEEPPPGVAVRQIAPTSLTVTRTCRDRQILNEAVDQGEDDGRREFGRIMDDWR